MAIKSIHVIRTNVQPTTLWMALAMAMSGLMVERRLSGVWAGYEDGRVVKYDFESKTECFGRRTKGWFASHEEVLAGTPEYVLRKAEKLAHSRKHQLVVIENSEKEFSLISVWYSGRLLFRRVFRDHRDYAGDIVYGGQVLNDLTFACYNRLCDWCCNRHGRMTAKDWESAGEQIARDYNYDYEEERD